MVLNNNASKGQIKTFKETLESGPLVKVGGQGKVQFQQTSRFGVGSIRSFEDSKLKVN